MIENFITSIYIKHSRKIKNFEIPISKDKRQHLILTGKNGSGKTSLLSELNKFLSKLEDGSFQHLKSQIEAKRNLEEYIKSPNYNEGDKSNFRRALKDTERWLLDFGGTNIEFSNNESLLFEKFQTGKFLLAFFDAKRHTNLTIPNGINKIILQKNYSLHDKVNPAFIQYIVNLKADRSFARDDNEMDTVHKIDAWFDNLENRLRYIFDLDNLKLYFDRKSYNFDIKVGENETFGFNTLSDGYSAIISIITELILRMEAHEVKSYDLEGIVIIDEIETHFNVELQKKILPFLTDFFPKIQFIVTTHSPFVLSSLSNATICDLETKIITNDLSSYSYDALIESYFKSDKYSEELKLKIKEFEYLITKENKTEDEYILLKQLRNYFGQSPKYLSDELQVKLQQLELIELTNNKIR